MMCNGCTKLELTWGDRVGRILNIIDQILHLTDGCKNNLVDGRFMYVYRVQIYIISFSLFRLYLGHPYFNCIYWNIRNLSHIFMGMPEICIVSVALVANPDKTTHFTG